jgi:hypothetical protein
MLKLEFSVNLSVGRVLLHQGKRTEILKTSTET